MQPRVDPSLVLPFFRHFWLLAIVVGVINVIILKSRFQRTSQQRPELADGYRRLLYGYGVFLTLPWIVMGVGIEAGGVPGPFSFLRPRDGNPYILAWFGCIIGFWLLGFFWIVVGKGAEFLVAHPGSLNGNERSPGLIRGFYCLLTAVGAYQVYSLFTASPPAFIK